MFSAIRKLGMAAKPLLSNKKFQKEFALLNQKSKRSFAKANEEESRKEEMLTADQTLSQLKDA